jgi:hypothetical protein
MTDPSISIVRCAQAGTPSSGCPPAAGAWTTVARAGAARAGAARATVAPSLCPARGRPFPARGSGPGAGPVPGPGRADLTGRPESRVDACGPGREASPPCSPAREPAAARCGGWAAPPVTARDPAPGPAGLPLRQGRAARRALPVRSRGTSRPRDRLSGPAWLLFPAGGQPLASAAPGGPGADGGRT